MAASLLPCVNVGNLRLPFRQFFPLLPFSPPVFIAGRRLIGFQLFPFNFLKRSHSNTLLTNVDPTCHSIVLGTYFAVIVLKQRDRGWSL